MNEAHERKFWSSYGKIYPYIERSTPYQELLRDIGGMIKPKKGEQWLDVGCGPGTVMQVIIKRSNGILAKLVGIDFDETMLTHAHEKMHKEQSVELLRVDLSERTPFPNETFDGIVANLVLTYVRRFEGREGEEALQGVLSEMYRILKTGGRFVWTTPVPNVNFWKEFWESRNDILRKDQIENLFYGPAIMRYALEIAHKGKRGDYSFFEAEKHVEILKKTGFQSVAAQTSFAKQALILSCRKQ